MDVEKYVENYHFEFSGGQTYTPSSHEKAMLVDAINGALGPAIEAAIAARNAFIRGAADKSEVKEAGARAVQERFPSDWDDIDPDDQREAIEWAEISFHAMLDQIERTPDEG